MAIAIERAPGGQRETVRQKRERDQELLVWPDLVFVEFICAVLFTITFVVLSVFVDAPLLNRANANITPNPSKAPWYFMNLQELLLHMDKGLAGVTVPTVALIVLAAIPYTDRSNDGQGTWFGTANAVRITVFSFIFTSFFVVWCVLWDDGAHVRVYTQIVQWIKGDEGHQVQWLGEYEPFGWLPGQLGNFVNRIYQLVMLPNRVGLRDVWHWSLPVPFQPGSGQHDGHLDWPQDFREIPVPFGGQWPVEFGEPKWMPAWLRHVYWYNSDFNVPAIMAEYVMPTVTVFLGAALLLLILRKLGMMNTVRDAWLALFTGFIVTYIALTAIGVAFRGKGQNLVLPGSVPNLEENPTIQRQYTPLPDAERYAIAMNWDLGIPRHA